MIPTQECSPPAMWERLRRCSQTNLAVPHHSSTRTTAHHVPLGTPPPLGVGTCSRSGSLGDVLLMGCAFPFRPMPARDGEIRMIPMSLAHVSWSRSPAPLKNPPA